MGITLRNTKVVWFACAHVCLTHVKGSTAQWLNADSGASRWANPSPATNGCVILCKLLSFFVLQLTHIKMRIISISYLKATIRR